MILSDTDQDSQWFLDNLIRDMPVWRRLEIVVDLYETSKQLALEGLCELYPEASDLELKRLLADLMLGPEIAKKVYGPLPQISQMKRISRYD